MPVVLASLTYLIMHTYITYIPLGDCQEQWFPTGAPRRTSAPRAKFKCAVRLSKKSKDYNLYKIGSGTLFVSFFFSSKQGPFESTFGKIFACGAVLCNFGRNFEKSCLNCNKKTSLKKKGVFRDGEGTAEFFYPLRLRRERFQVRREMFESLQVRRSREKVGNHWFTRKE